VQGIGGAIVEAVALALLMNLFTEPAERAKAMGVYGFVCAAAGSIGVLLGGVLTGAYDWHWIFLVNLPIGAGGARPEPVAAARAPSRTARGRASTSAAR
jgi:MFS family permease